MKQVKYYCDRCKSEEEEGFIYGLSFVPPESILFKEQDLLKQWYRVFGAPPQLCRKCMKEFERWLLNKPAVKIGSATNGNN